MFKWGRWISNGSWVTHRPAQVEPPSPLARRFGDALMDRARPVVSSISMRAPQRATGPRATGKLTGMLERKRWTMGSISRPRMDSVGPHMPASQRKAVPPGKTRSSAVCVWVWVPTTAETRPSRKRPMAIFSLVVSAWASTKMTGVSSRMSSHDAVERRERVIERGLHESAALDIDDADLSLRRFEHDGALAGDALGVIDRAQQARLGVDEGGEIFLVPDVVAGGDDRDAGAQEVDGDPRRDAAAPGGVLAIDDDEIDAALLFPDRDRVDDGPAARLANNIA